MRIALGSIFRNSSPYLDRYFQQVSDLRDALRLGSGGTDHLRLILGEGDSTDDTLEQLIARSGTLDAHIVKRDHGGPVFESVESDQRWKQISYVCNGVLERVTEQDDFFIWVESDIIWKPITMVELIHHVYRGADAVAPMCYGVKGLFYDVWGFRKDGRRFEKLHPYHPGLNGRLTDIDSAGSCIAMRAEIARRCRFEPPEQGIVGFCGRIREAGWRLAVDPGLEVRHP